MSGSGILLLFLSSSLIFLLMGLALVLYVMQYQKRMMQQAEELKEKETIHQEKLLKATIESQEKERSRIAGHLHDGLGALLSTIRLNVLLYGQEHEASKVFSEETAELLSNSIREVREISHDLLPGTLKNYGLMVAWKELFKQVSRYPAIEVSLEETGKTQRLSNNMELALYRVSQELLNNSLRHAKASKIALQVFWQEKELRLTYTDDGIGFEPEKAVGGLGLYNMQSRTQSLGGSILIDSEPGKGVEVSLCVPLESVQKL